MKQCGQCKKTKPIVEFSKCKNNPDGLHWSCKACQKDYRKKYYLRNKEKENELSRKYHKEHRSEVNEKKRAMHVLNADKERLYRKEYRKANKIEIDQKNAAFKKRQYKTNAQYRLKKLMAKRIWHSLKGLKNGHWEELVGYKVEDLIKHLKSTLPNGYCWKDYVNGAKLHIDHIVPIAVHNFKTPDDIDFKRCWDLKNLRLIPAAENLAKSDKIDRHFQPNLIGL